MHEMYLSDVADFVNLSFCFMDINKNKALNSIVERNSCRNDMVGDKRQSRVLLQEQEQKRKLERRSKAQIIETCCREYKKAHKRIKEDLGEDWVTGTLFVYSPEKWHHSSTHVEVPLWLH